MTALQAALLVALAAAVGGFAAWVYARRELPIPGRRLPAALRVGALAVLLLLLFDPSLPASGGGSAADERWWLVDASASMAWTPPGGGRPAPWDSAVALVRDRAAPGAPLLAFGEGVTPLPVDSLAARAPGQRGSRVAPALERAAESGARSVTVVTDLRLEDPVAAAAAAAGLGLEVEWRDVGSPLADVGVESLDLPGSVGPGRGPVGEVVVTAEGAAPGDSVAVEVLEEGRPVLSTVVAAPAEGRRRRIPLELPPPRERDGAEVRYEVRVSRPGAGPDDVPSDDAAVAWVATAPGAGEVVAVSTTPGWEARFLVPVLGAVTGLPARGFLRLTDPGGRWLATSGGEGGEGTATSETVAAAARSAEVLVVLGEGREAPPWLEEAARAASRLLVVPGDAEAAAWAGAGVAAVRPGEWYVSADLPPSPLAGELAGVAVGGLPPLGPLLEVGGTGAGQVPLRVQLRGSGRPEAGMLLLDGDGRRRAVALAAGHWRWAFRPGEAREAYRRLWSGVAGWLLAGDAAVAEPPLRPPSLVAAGSPVPWAGREAPGREVRLRIRSADSTVVDTVVVPGEGGPPTTAPLPPGLYRWSAAADGDSASGRLEVRAAAVEPFRPRVEPPVAPAGRLAAADGAQGAPRPLRSHPLPYLLVMGLLCAEWVVRRRRGLR